MECYSLQLVTAPADQPVDFARAKRQLRLEDDFIIDDELISHYIKSIVEEMESVYGYAFCTQTWKVFFNRFPYNSTYEGFSAVELPKPPLQTVTHVKYYDDAGVQQTLATTEYVVDAVGIPGKIVPAYGKYWPRTRSELPNAIEIQFVCGYGAAAAVPARIQHELLIRLTEAYEHRGDMAPDNLKRAVAIGSWPERNIRV